MVAGIHREHGSRPFGLHHEIEAKLLDCDQERGIRHLDPVGMRLPTRDRALTVKTRRQDLALLSLSKRSRRRPKEQPNGQEQSQEDALQGTPPFRT